MRCPFPGMDPYLEHPALWPDVHNRLIAAIADDLGPRLAPRYFVALERRTYRLKPGDIAFVGLPDVTIAQWPPSVREHPEPWPEGDTAVVEVDVPIPDEVSENYLEVRETGSAVVVTVLELLSPANKVHSRGRQQYLAKRDEVFMSGTNLVEVDLMRAGERMPVIGSDVASDYRILVSRASKRPKAQLLPFSVRQPIPKFSLPLLPGDDEPRVDLKDVLHALYERARFDLRLDYNRPPVPPLTPPDDDWSRARVAHADS